MKRPTLLLALLVSTLLALAWRGGATPASASDPAILRVGVREVARPFTGDDGASALLDRRLEIEGEGFYGTAFGPFVRLELPDETVHEAPLVVLESSRLILAWPPPGLRGPATLVVVNPDGRQARHAVGL